MKTTNHIANTDQKTVAKKVSKIIDKTKTTQIYAETLDFSFPPLQDKKVAPLFSSSYFPTREIRRGLKREQK